MPASALNWLTAAGLAKAMSRTGEPAGAVLVIRGPVRSKAKPFVSPCLRSSMSGLSRRLLIGARSSELSVRCNASAGRNSSNPYPIPVAESDWVKKCWGSSKGHSKQTGHTQTHCYGRSSDMRALQNRANYTIRPRNHRSQRQNSSQNIAKMSVIPYPKCAKRTSNEAPSTPNARQPNKAPITPDRGQV